MDCLAFYDCGTAQDAEAFLGVFRHGAGRRADGGGAGINFCLSEAVALCRW